MYQQFMLCLIQQLEPVDFLRDTELLKVGEPVYAAMFLDGQVDIGFMIEDKEVFKLRLHRSFIMGAFECCFSKPS
jgi:hypothetical protein